MSGIEYRPMPGSTYTSPTDPVDSGAMPRAGDMWIDTEHGGRVKVADGMGGWTEVEVEAPEDRWKREAEKADGGDATRLGDHRARKTADGWVCEACGGESADAGVLAETDCD